MVKTKGSKVTEENGFIPVQYKILKLSAKKIVKSKVIEVDKKKGTGKDRFYSVPEIPLINWLTMSHGDSGLVSVGDNILFQKIREVRNPNCMYGEKGEEITPNEQQYRAYLKQRDFTKEIKKLKREIDKNPKHKKIKDLNKKILEKEESLFIPDVINVESNKTDYNKFAKKGFYYGGKKYVRRSAGSGNLKQNTVTFIMEDIADEVVKKLRIGFLIDIETTEVLPPTKFGAYEGLTTTGCVFVRKPKVIVIPDFEYITFKDKDNKEHRVYFVTKNEEKTGYNIDIRPFFETKEEVDDDGNFIRYNSYLNSFDGMGLIDPGFAKEWADDLHIKNYVPSAFIVRSIGVKGLLVTFPFKEYARAKKLNTIIDVRYKGMSEEDVEHISINNVDVILTESQWKYKKLYKKNGMGYNFDCYNGNPETMWGVSRYAPEVDKDCTRLNYQLITTSNIKKDEDIERVITPTRDYLRLLAEGKPEHILYALTKDVVDGKNKDDEETDDIEDIDESDYELFDTDEAESTEASNDKEESERLKTTTLNNAILKNHDLIQDSYIGGQIENIIKSYLDRAKAGKLYPEGNSNYQFMISDPYALCQWAFRWFDWMDIDGEIEEVHKKRIDKVSRDIEAEGFGLIPPRCVYSSYWNKKNVSKISACRSPMTDIAEHNILTVCNKDNVYQTGINPDIYDEMERYYKYIDSGIIYSLHDLSTLIHSDSDFDGDIVCTLNSSVYVENAWDVYPTTYYKGADEMKPSKYETAKAVESDLQGFGNKVGVYSNMSTSLFAMMPLFEVDEEKAEITVNEDGTTTVKHPEYLHHTDSDYSEYDCSIGQLELFKSIKKDRYLIGEEIDSTKTGKKPTLLEEFLSLKWQDSKDEIRRFNQAEREEFAYNLQESNKFKPQYLPYFFINVKASYKDKWTKYVSRMRDICKFYTYESINTFVPDMLHGKRELQTDDEKYFWNYFVNHSPLLLTDCLMNKICWKLEVFEDEMKKTIKANWNHRDNYVLMGYAKDVDVTDKTKKFVKAEYEKYVKELMQIYNKNNSKKANDEKTELFKVGKRDALVFQIRMELLEELKVGFSEIFNILVTVLKESPKSKYNSINGFIWNIMDDDILDVIPPHEKEIRWDEFVDGSDSRIIGNMNILGKDVTFWERKREITEEKD